MKKNRMMRLASVMLVAVLMTTCTISGTFAKYVTEGTGTDSARVAKWGVKVTGNGTTFAEKYETDDSTAGVGTYSVISSTPAGANTDHIVAPGTDGVMAKATITGVPEVAVKITYEATTFDLGQNWNDGTNYYCPLVIQVNDQKFYGMDYTSADAFEAAVVAAIAGYSTQVYPAHTDLSAVTDSNLYVAWAWAFEKDDVVLGVTCDENDDVKDTYLGDQAAAGNAATITLAVTTTVTQVD